MRPECFPACGVAPALLVAALIGSAPLAAQEPEAGTDEPPVRFEPRYIDADAYRDGQVLLHDWPALTRLVRWTTPVAQAVAEPDSTLSSALVEEFRNRVAELADAEPPAFLASRADSVRAVLRDVEAGLERAEAMLAESLPGEIATPTGEARPNQADRDRTYATGPTAVRVPAGVDVGEADTLPGARLAGAVGEPNYVDLVAQALDRLDALVHLVRKLGVSTTGAPARRDPTSSPGTEPLRPAP